MNRRIGAWFAVLACLIAASAAAAQDWPQDRPATTSRPWTQQELDCREAAHLYALGLIQERDSRLVEASRTYESALKLDPDSTTLRKSLIPLYLGLDRTDDALRTCRETLEVDPGDHETWFIYARELKSLERPRDAADAMTKGVRCPSLKDNPLLHVQMLFDLALLQDQLDNFKAAEAALVETAGLLERNDLLEEHGARPEEIRTQSAEVYERLGRVCVKAKRFDQAVDAFRKAGQKDPQRGRRLSFNLAEVYLGQNQFDQALTAIDDYLTTRPVSTEAYELKVSVLEKLGRGDSVLPALREYVRSDPENTSLKLFLAKQCVRAKRAGEADGIYQAMLEKSADVEIYRGLLTLYRDQGTTGGERILKLLDEKVTSGAGAKDKPGDTADAARAKSILAVLREDGGCVKVMLPAVRRRLQANQAMHAETRRVLAALAGRAHQLEEAEALYRSCLDSTGAFGRRNEHEIYGGLLLVLRMARKQEAIIAVCQKGLETAQATNRVLFHHDQAMALMALGKVEEALKEVDNAVDNSDADNRLNMRQRRVFLLGEAGKHDQAIAEGLEVLKEAKPGEEVRDAHHTLSAAYSAAKNYPKAEEHLRKILTAYPDDPGAHNDLGYLLADQGHNLEEAEKLVVRALELDRKQRKSSAEADEDNAAYVDSLGWVYFRRGKLAEARHELERAAAMFGGEDDPVVWDHLGDVYNRLGESAKAKTAWQKALGFFEGGRRRQAEDRFKDIKQKLKALESSAADGAARP